MTALFWVAGIVLAAIFVAMIVHAVCRDVPDDFPARANGATRTLRAALKSKGPRDDDPASTAG